MPAWCKLALVGEINRAVRDLALVELRQRCLASLLLRPELATRTYGLAPGEN